MSKLKHVVTDLQGNIIRVEEMRDDVDVREQLRQAIHDCPECRAAAALGEIPYFATDADVGAMNERPRRPLFARRPRWRDLKRRR